MKFYMVQSIEPIPNAKWRFFTTKCFTSSEEAWEWITDTRPLAGDLSFRVVHLSILDIHEEAK